MRRISTKRRKELYGLTSLLLHLLVFIGLLISLGTDSNDENIAKNKPEIPKQEDEKPTNAFFVTFSN